MKSLEPKVSGQGACEPTTSALRRAEEPEGIGDDDESGADVCGDGHP